MNCEVTYAGQVQVLLLLRGRPITFRASSVVCRPGYASGCQPAKGGSEQAAQAARLRCGFRTINYTVSCYCPTEHKYFNKFAARVRHRPVQLAKARSMSTAVLPVADGLTKRKLCQPLAAASTSAGCPACPPPQAPRTGAARSPEQGPAEHGGSSEEPASVRPSQVRLHSI